jgi:D-xylose transport system permease protein
VLLLGEIDLSVGPVSGLAAAIVGSLSVKSAGPRCRVGARGCRRAMAIGASRARSRRGSAIPTFVVTLAGLLTWQGAQLKVLGYTGTLNITDPTLTGLTSTFFSDAVGWAGWRGWPRGCCSRPCGAGSGGPGRACASRSRCSRGAADPRPAAAIIATVAVLNADRGVPLALLILVALVMVVNTVLTRSTFGRHIYAIGGNAEAARRAGIRVHARCSTIVFMLASLMAASAA